MTPDMSTPKELILATAAELGLTIKSDFIPFSKSRNKASKSPSLNWIVRLLRNEMEVLECEYSAGCAHCSGYKQRETYESKKAVASECELGVTFILIPGDGTTWENGRMPAWKSEPILPDLADVLHSLVSDSNVLDFGSYESWASDYGYDPDSRKGEATYRECLRHAMALRAALSSDQFDRLREACQDY